MGVKSSLWGRRDPLLTPQCHSFNDGLRLILPIPSCYNKRNRCSRIMRFGFGDTGVAMANKHRDGASKLPSLMTSSWLRFD